MKRHDLAIVPALIIFMTTCGYTHAENSLEALAGEVEAVASQYFYHFERRDWPGMESLLTPEVEIMDYGEAFNLAEWKWYMHIHTRADVPGEKPKSEKIDPIVLSDFKTVVGTENFAYTDYKKSWESKPDYYEIGSIVFLRVKGKWLIDRLSTFRGETWHPWLRARAHARGGSVEGAWYPIFLTEVQARIKPPYYKGKDETWPDVKQ